jgi:hypothetical protein
MQTLCQVFRFFNQLLGPLMWGMNYFDQNMVFRDQDSKEIFVFDTNGIWNQDTLNHKLIN